MKTKVKIVFNNMFENKNTNISTENLLFINLALNKHQYIID